MTNSMKNILAIHDISCVGRCSTTVALPIISAFGVECRLLPTALLSTHTAGFEGFTYLDLTSEMKKILRAWEPLNLKFDAIYSGFMASAEQIDVLKTVLRTYHIENVKAVIDPVMADNGELYRVFDQNFVEKMKEIIPFADYLTPNITEACLLTDTPYQKTCEKKFVEQLAEKLRAKGAKTVILTGVSFEENHIGALVMDDKGKVNYAFSEHQPDIYHGTGDMFGSVLSAELVKGKSLIQSAQSAADFIVEAIKATPQDADKRFGVNFEMALNNKMKQ